jgi:flagellar hook-associated protein 2
LFASTGNTNDSLVTYNGADSNTKVGSYALNLTQLGTKGVLSGAAAAGLTITAGVNDTLGIIIDGVSASIALNAGTYVSADALAAELQSKISGTSAFSSAGVQATVTQTGGVLSITSARYGSASTVTADGSNAALNLLGANPAATAGKDVAGTLGDQAFVGSGQNVAGANGSATQGLSLTVLGGSTGARGSVAYSRGIATQMDDLLNQFLDPHGLLASKTDGINATIKDLQAQEASWNLRLQSIRARYEAQYNAMDSLVASMNATSSYLTQQIAALENVMPKSSNNKN